MYPIPVQDVMGLGVRSVASGVSSTILSFDDHTASWGGSPTYGELGYGAKGVKSSTKPKYVDDLEGATVLSVAMGMAHSLAIVDVDNSAGQQVMAKLPVFQREEPAKPAESNGKAATNASSKKKAKAAPASKKRKAGDEGEVTAAGPASKGPKRKMK